MNRRASAIGFAPAVLTMLLLVNCATAQQIQPTAGNADWDFGYELFQALLEQQDLTPVDYESVITDDPRNSVLVIQGKVDSEIATQIPVFCERGGSVLIACDSTTYLGSTCTFEEGPVVTLDTVQMYQGFADCIRISEFSKQHPLMSGIGSLIVNKSGWLKKPLFGTDDLDVIVRLPPSCEPVESAGEPLLATFDVASLRGGKLVLCADQSLFTNGMLWHADNSMLAINIANFLAEGGQRSQICFVVKGQSQGSYRDSPSVNPGSDAELPDIDLPEPKLKTMLKVANKIVKNVEESNIANEFLAKQPRGVKAAYYRRGILFVLAAIVIGLVTRFLFGSFAAAILICGATAAFFAIDSIATTSLVSWIPGKNAIVVFLKTFVWVPAIVYVLLKLFTESEPARESVPSRTMKTAFDLRAEKKITDSEFGFAASMLARELCKEVTESSDPAVWLRKLKPNSAIKTRSKAKSDLQVPLSTVVDLAVNSQTTHISRTRFANIGHTINELRTMHRQGRLLPAASNSSSPS